MKTQSIKATSRTDVSAKDLRTSKRVPGVIYGHQHETKPLSVNTKEFRDVFHKAGYSSLIDLELDGEDKTIKAIIHEVQFHPLTDEYIHVDFFAINMKEPITTHIPIQFVGESAAIKNLGAMFITNKDEITIKCLPGDLVHHVEVDIASLENFGDSLKITDIKLPDTIEILHDDEETIAQAQEPRVVEEEEPAAEETAEGEGAEGGEGEGEAKEGEEGEKKEESDKKEE